MTTMPSRRRAAKTKSKGAFLQVDLEPYRPGGPDRHMMVAVCTIKSVAPPTVLTTTTVATGEAITEVPDPRYRVAYRNGRALEHGRVTRANLEAVGIPVPDGYW